MNYSQCYQRNIGLFTEEQQEKLRSAKVVVAGVGGVGGIEAVTLAKMGLGELVIFDPGVFDEPDMNRQYGAVKSNIGKNKAIATGEMLKDINPFMKVTVLDYAPTTKNELDELLSGASAAIDAIDYIGFDYKVFFARAVRDHKIYNFTAPISGFATLMIILDPTGLTLEELYDAPESEDDWREHKIPLPKLFGEDNFGYLIADMIEKRRNYLSNCAGIAMLNGGLVASEIAMLITGLRKPDELICAPNTLGINLLNRKLEIKKLFRED